LCRSRFSPQQICARLERRSPRCPLRRRAGTEQSCVHRVLVWAPATRCGAACQHRRLNDSARTQRNATSTQVSRATLGSRPNFASWRKNGVRWPFKPNSLATEQFGDDSSDD
jgi:hypothetical protein